MQLPRTAVVVGGNRTPFRASIDGGNGEKISDSVTSGPVSMVPDTPGGAVLIDGRSGPQEGVARLTLDGAASVRACLEPARDGDEVRTQEGTGRADLA